MDGATPDSWSAPGRASATGITYSRVQGLQSGEVLAGRYEIVQLLGEGGMGAVFKAQDRELDRVVAVKVIHPDLSRRPEILKRFKQELNLARQVTHENVVRIFDLGHVGDLRFITMEFIDGQDLKTLLGQRGKFPVDEATSIIRQVCRALHAAHGKGIVHRDLKPANVMIDPQGIVRVMDFGIARAMDGSGLTQTREVLGTPDYMSPEQVRGQKVDPRSDLFALGIIFYELLTGKTPFEAETALERLLKRTQEQARPPVELEPELPPAINDLVMKCLQMDPQLRYQDAREILQDLEGRSSTRTGLTPVGAAAAAAAGSTGSFTGAAVAPAEAAVAAPSAEQARDTASGAPALPRPWLVRLPWKWIAAGSAVLLLAVAGFIFRGKGSSRAPAGQKAVTLLVADFDNTTGDSVFEGTLEPALILAVEGTSFISSYPRGDARKIAAQVQPGATRLDESLARLVAVRQGINVVVTGSIARQGDGYKVAVRAIDAATGKQIHAREIEVADKTKLLGAMGKLAAPVRTALGDSTPESVQLASAETFTSGSLEAAHLYAKAQELQRAGKSEEAIQDYSAAVGLDQDFGRAYAGLAVAYANLGQPAEAEKYYKMAMSRIDRMTDREKYRTRGGYYLFLRNYPKAIEEFSALVKQYPGDSAGYGNLALANFFGRNMGRAIEEVRHALEISPKDAIQRTNLALYAMYAGDFETAAKEGRALLETNRSLTKPHIAVAMAELAQGRPAQAAESYRRLESVGARGASLAAIGLADLALYEGRLADAIAILEKGAAADSANNNAAATAYKNAVLSQTFLIRGQRAPALAACDRALAAGKDDAALFLGALTYLQAGQEAKARALASQLSARLEPEPKAYGKLLEGEIQSHRKNSQEAIRLLQEAQKLADTWLGRFALGRAYIEAQAYTEAYSELELCLKRRGEATAVFLDDLPTYRFLPQVYYYMGRAQDGLKSSGAAESYRTFLSIKQKDEGDPLVADARHRLAAR